MFDSGLAFAVDLLSCVSLPVVLNSCKLYSATWHATQIALFIEAFVVFVLAVLILCQHRGCVLGSVENATVYFLVSVERTTSRAGLSHKNMDMLISSAEAIWMAMHVYT